MNRGLQEGDKVRGQGSQATAEQEIFFFVLEKKCQYFVSAIITRKKEKKVRIRRRRQERDYRSASHWAGKDSVFLMALGWMGLAPPISGHVRTGQGGLDG